MGKDNVIAVEQYIHQELKELFPMLACLKRLDVARLSYQGLLEDLLAGVSPNKLWNWLTWSNSEIAQCFKEGI